MRTVVVLRTAQHVLRTGRDLLRPGSDLLCSGCVLWRTGPGCGNRSAGARRCSGTGSEGLMFDFRL